MSINLVNLVGRVGGDPDIKYFESGSVICTLSLAVSRRSKGSPPDWFRLKLWGQTAEVAANYVRKGSLIGVSGSLEIERWTDRQTGEERENPVIVVKDLSLLGSKKENESGGSF